MLKTHSKLLDPAEFATWLSGCVAIAMHFTGSLPLEPAALGAMVTAAIMPIAMALVRLVSRIVSGLPDAVPRDEEGKASVAAVILMLVVGLVACGSTYTLKSGGWRLSANDDGSACLVVHGDGNPEVTKVCIDRPSPIKISAATRAKLCAQDERSNRAEGGALASGSQR